MKSRMKVEVQTEQRRERKKKKTLRCREFHTVEVGFMVGGKDRDERLLPSLSNCGRRVRVQDFQEVGEVYRRGYQR